MFDHGRGLCETDIVLLRDTCDALGDDRTVHALKTDMSVQELGCAMVVLHSATVLASLFLFSWRWRFVWRFVLFDGQVFTISVLGNVVPSVWSLPMTVLDLLSACARTIACPLKRTLRSTLNCRGVHV